MYSNFWLEDLEEKYILGVGCVDEK